jgi:hypothetical protein
MLTTTAGLAHIYYFTMQTSACGIPIRENVRNTSKSRRREIPESRAKKKKNEKKYKYK